MKKVHDILYHPQNGSAVSFIQWGNSEEGFKYQVICPYCARDVGWVIDTEDEMTVLQLHNALRKEMGLHISFCPYPGGRFLVEVTQERLHTDREPPKVM